MQNLIYTSIQHQPRKKWGLSMNDYVLCDMIYHLSNNPLYNWCIMSKENMAKELGLSKRGILNMLDEMINQGWIIRDIETKFLKASKKWYDEFVVYGEKSAPSVQKGDENGAENTPKRGKKCTPTGEKSAPYNNTDIDIYNKEIIYSENETINKNILEFIENRKQLKKPMTDLAIEKLVDKTKKWIASYSIDDISGFFYTAIECGWQGVFEPKKSFQKSSGKKLACEDENARKDWEF